MKALNISDADVDAWLPEERQFLKDVRKEPEGDLLKVEYVEQLQKLKKALCV